VCGIVGIVGRDDSPERALAAQRGLAAIRHRGPDDLGVVCIPQNSVDPTLRAVFGNARLAIQDLSPLGHMPMASRDGAVYLTYNGEIYNFRELRAELHTLGRAFRSTGDTEVLLQAYEEWGDGFLARLNGMFALSIADYRQRQPRILLARDRLGIKPCYYTWRDEQLFFASELKGLGAMGVLPREIDWQGVWDYFTYLFIPGPRTAYAGVRQLTPGTKLILDSTDGEPRVERYWSPLEADTATVGATAIGETARELRELLRQSVRSHLISDVPIGVFLSGGIDSTILTALAARETRGDLQTFTVVFEGEGIATVDDSYHARRVSERYGTDHHEITIDVSNPDEMLNLGAMFDQPFGNPTYYLSYLIAQETHQYVKVALSGAGGDELFAGYPRYRALAAASLLERTPLSIARAARAVVGRWRENYDNMGPRRAKLLLRGAGERFSEQWVRWTYYFSDREKEVLLAPLRIRHPGLFPAVRIVDGLMREAGNLDLGTRAQYADLMTFLPDNVLEYTDRSSMAVSLEVRVPFLDHRIVECSFRTPFSQKLHRGQSKMVLRQAFADLIPPENARAPKRGFSPPLAMWMDRELDRYFDRDLTRDYVELTGIFDWDEIQRLRIEHRHRITDNSMKLFGILMFDRWWRRHLGDN
jgi:asparagine synthase (glutamine-hydrolysing)